MRSCRDPLRRVDHEADKAADEMRAYVDALRSARYAKASLLALEAAERRSFNPTHEYAELTRRCQ